MKVSDYLTINRDVTSQERLVGNLSGVLGTSLLWLRLFSAIRSAGRIEWWSAILVVVLFLAMIGLNRLAMNHMRDKRIAVEGMIAAEQVTAKRDPLWDHELDS
jgi:hypothetical protein